MPIGSGNCDQVDPAATQVVVGHDAGLHSPHRAFFHGQNVVTTGVYLLAHRVDAALQLSELRYDDHAASCRTRIAWACGYPTMRVLRKCPAAAIC
jgi:hypothetical protein